MVKTSPGVTAKLRFDPNLDSTVEVVVVVVVIVPPPYNPNPMNPKSYKLRGSVSLTDKPKDRKRGWWWLG